MNSVEITPVPEVSPGGVWVGTYTGRRFYPFAPRVEDVSILDIAHSLAHQCRFNGHGSHFYSVAQHSVEVSKHVHEDDALWGLLHDSAEAYLSDIVRPIKPFLSVHCGKVAAFYSKIEDRILEVIAMRYGLPWPMPKSVDEADLRMLATERRELFGESQPEWPDLAGVDPYARWPTPIESSAAKKAFLDRFWS